MSTLVLTVFHAQLHGIKKKKPKNTTTNKQKPHKLSINSYDIYTHNYINDFGGVYLITFLKMMN